MKRRLICILILIIPFVGWGQEYWGGVSGNSVIKDHVKNQVVSFKSYVIEYEGIEMPFFDDFSNLSVYPDSSRWIDNEAYINADYPINPPNYGVATLDVIDANGNVYPEASPFPFIADRLTSRPIRLDSIWDDGEQQMNPITIGDSIYLSFYYQPQGRGDYPLPYDSLMLDFGFYNGDTVFSHIDSVVVFGSDYPDIASDGYFPPNTVIYPPLPCDTTIPFVLQDTLFIDGQVTIPCDSVFVLDSDWTPIWNTKGIALEEFVLENDVYFSKVTVPILDTNWLRKDFQFRFLNYGSVSTINSWQSNTDHWHIDDVYLDINRKYNDHYRHAARFVEPAPSFIKDYYSMPFNHYSYFLKKDSISAYVNNLDSIDHNSFYTYYVQNEDGDTLPAFEYDGFTGVSAPYFNQSSTDFGPFAMAPVNYFFTSPSDGIIKFKISHVVYDANDPSIGDTIEFEQKFHKYFAYDDGTAEAGYGLTPAGSQLAVKFTPGTVDTLRGVQMFFNKTLNGHNDRLFHIIIWNDDNGKPGVPIYTLENQRPQFKNLNQYHTYVFPEYLKLGNQVFYVGVEQTTNDYLNLGLDKNIDSRLKNFYDVGPGWTTSSIEGSLMIRPVVGSEIVLNTQEYRKETKHIMVYPNPAKYGQEIYIDISQINLQNSAKMNDLTINIFNMYGKLVYSAPYQNSLHTDILHHGIYLLNMSDKRSGNHYTSKLIIQ